MPTQSIDRQSIESGARPQGTGDGGGSAYPLYEQEYPQFGAGAGAGAGAGVGVGADDYRMVMRRLDDLPTGAVAPEGVPLGPTRWPGVSEGGGKPAVRDSTIGLAIGFGVGVLVTAFVVGGLVLADHLITGGLSVPLGFSNLASILSAAGVLGGSLMGALIGGIRGFRQTKREPASQQQAAPQDSGPAFTPSKTPYHGAGLFSTAEPPLQAAKLSTAIQAMVNTRGIQQGYYVNSEHTPKQIQQVRVGVERVTGYPYVEYCSTHPESPATCGAFVNDKGELVPYQGSVFVSGESTPVDFSNPVSTAPKAVSWGLRAVQDELLEALESGSVRAASAPTL